MRRNKLTINRQTIRLLADRELTHAIGGVTGPPCDTDSPTRCDFGCATGGNPCFGGESAQTQGNCR